jgi:5'-nucleotidase (lipoprotein e(P4) family)
MDTVMQLQFLTAASLGAVLIAVQPAGAAPLTYDCQAYITRVETVPPVVAGDGDPWQCRTPNARASTATHWFRNSLEYCRLAVNIYDEALRVASHIAATHRRQQWIVMLDADETVLDNSLFERERNRCGSEFKDAQWESWVHADMARAVPGAAQFTQTIHRMGGLIAIITNRIAADDEITQRTLRRAGIWFDYEEGAGDTSDKTLRWRKSESELAGKFGRHAKAVMWIGDQMSDLAVLNRKGAILRAMSQKDAGLGIGRYLIVLPNPMYGGWMDNSDR